MAIPASLPRACTLALLALAACAKAPEGRRVAPPPQVAGTRVAVGLRAPVRILRDRWGVPHITAETPEDLFFAQGFVQAQDRLFQMDLWRRSVRGELSAVLGPNFIERDAMTRRVQYRGDRDADWASYGPDARIAAVAFTRGINAWIRAAADPLPDEFRLAGWAPELWRPDDLLNRTDAFLAGGDARAEVFRTQLSAVVGAARATALLPAVPGPPGVPRGLEMAAVGAVIGVVGEILRRVGTPPFFVGLAGPLNVVPHRAGSNAWAVARGEHGAPILAGDPHRALEHPSLRYLVHLQAPGWNVIGATAPWLPGVAIGHNSRVAWSMTASSADTQDIYVERVNPENPHQVLDRGRYVDMAVEQDAIVVKGRAEPFEYERLYTAHGAVVALDRERHLAFTIRWSGTEPGAASELGALAIDRASSAAEFQDALASWKAPAAEFVYADVDGHVARHVAALVPMRVGWNGAWPVPAANGDYEWKGWTPLAALPRGNDPASPYVTSANESRARLARIDAALADPRARSLDASKALQHDVLAWNARQLVPLLARLRADRADVDGARQRLLQWDQNVNAGSPDAALYVRWEARLGRELAALRVPAALIDEYVERSASLLVPSVVAPSRVWFDGNVERARDLLLLSALAGAVDQSPGAADRAVTFAHPLGVSDPSRRRFNLGPFTLPGYAETVFSIRAIGSGLVVGPSLRLVMDAGDWDRSVATNAPGQSGSPDSPHFGDLARLWAAGEYFPLAFSNSAIQAATESVLTLTPR